ncbi:hypothetical protein IKF84_02100 [Candidatus Saccharibacteria bacterium]|nr:hypothetical protein [Candidatus Saccharibacteria bacterium]
MLVPLKKKMVKESPKGTLIVKEIRNLTNTPLAVYDQSGRVVILRPEELKMRNGKLPFIGDTTYVVVDETVDEELLNKLRNDNDYRKKLAIPRPIGKIRDGQEGYHLLSTGPFGGLFFVVMSSNQEMSFNRMAK